MGLDVNTERGKESVLFENKMLLNIEKCWKYSVVTTNKEDSATCDGFLVRKKEIKALFESKCRNMSLNKLEEYGSWLITYEKLEKCKTLSEHLKVPFIGFLYLIKDDITLYWKITDSNGIYLFDFTVANTLTQKTINGGLINRDNAYLPLEYAKYVHMEDLKIIYLGNIPFLQSGDEKYIWVRVPVSQQIDYKISIC